MGALDDYFRGGAKPKTSVDSPLDKYFGKTTLPTPSGTLKAVSSSYFVGNGYGYASSTDPFSGKPILKAPLTFPETHRTPEFTIQVNSPERVATTFDPTKPQKITRDMLRNERLPSSASQSIRKELGAAYNEELDHQIALTLSGANTKDNLKLVPTAKNQAAGTIEAQLANDVIAGKVSLLDAQLKIAEIKGVKLPESKPTLIAKVRNSALKLPEEILQSMEDIQKRPLGKISDVLKIPSDIWSTIANASQAEADRLTEFIQSFKSKTTTSAKVGAGLKLVSATAGALFSPISALFKAAEDIPLASSLAKTAGLVFYGVGESGKALASMALDLSGLPTETKDNIREGLDEISSLAAQIVAGGAVAKGTGLLRGQSKTVVDAVKKSNPELAEKVDAIPAKRVDAIVEKSGVEGAKTIVAEAAKLANEKVGTNVETDKVTTGPLDAYFQGKKAPEIVLQTETTKASTIGKSIETKAVEDRLTQGFKDTAQYEPITIKDQAMKATRLINSDIEGARSMVRGEKPLPENLRGASVITAMEEYIKRTKDIEAAYELANSPLVSETSIAAQELRLVAERTPDSATAKLIELKKFRDDKALRSTKQTKGGIKRQVASEAKKVNLTKEELSWNKFLDAIVC